MVRINWIDPVVVKLCRDYSDGRLQNHDDLQRLIFEATGIMINRRTLTRRLPNAIGNDYRQTGTVDLSRSGSRPISHVRSSFDEKEQHTHRIVSQHLLSTKLKNTMLEVDEGEGRFRHYLCSKIYRNTDGVTESRYYLSEYCTRLNTNEKTGINPKLTICNGAFVGNQRPQHHHSCHTYTQTESLASQIDRQSKLDVRTGKHPPREKETGSKKLEWFTSMIILFHDFTLAAEQVKKLKQSPSNDEMLELYGLFKQVTVGDINMGKPLLDLKGRAKWDAWQNRKGTSQEDAKTTYIELVQKLIAKYGM